MSFENPSRTAIEKSETSPDLREYFQSYVVDAESHENQDAFTDLDTIKGILVSIDNGEYSSARDYLDSEISRMKGIHEEFPLEAEEGRPYLEKIMALRNSLS